MSGQNLGLPEGFRYGTTSGISSRRQIRLLNKVMPMIILAKFSLTDIVIARLS
jgi:hypothetical protein